MRPATPQSLTLRLLALTALVPMMMTNVRAQDLEELYRDEAGQIIGAAMVDDEGWEKLEHLTTVIGHRLSGSQALDDAIDWALEAMESEGLEGVTRQPITVPHWVRGNESATLVEPYPRDLAMLGLGGSVGTPAEGIEAPVVVVRSFDELDAKGRAAVEGKIVVYAVEWQGYGRTVQYRSQGASRAAALGAVGALVRSATGSSLYTPHTGGMRYTPGTDRIPAAAITPEDAELLWRLQERGVESIVRLQMEAETLPDAESANVLAEIRGRELPDEVVVMGGHIDSWDVGEGAHDDGAACIAAWQALTIIKRLGLRPRRTLRVVLWTNEENGLAGGVGYRQSLGADVGNHVAAIEMDSGAERPVGFGFSMPGLQGGGFGRPAEPGDERYEAAYAKVVEIGKLLDGIGAGEMTRGGGGADISPLMREGVPGFGLRTVAEHYFDWHHTHADTLDKVDPVNVQKATAMLGVLGYVLADMPTTLSSSQ